jgi:protein O-GlcNAc transferase
MRIDQNLAREHLMLKNFELAVSHYQELIANTPENFSLYLELSSALMGLHKYDEALVVIKQLENINFELSAEVVLQKGNIYLAQARYKEAIAILHALIPGQCEDRARTALSSAYLKIGMPTLAASIFENIDPRKFSIGDSNNLAISLCEQMESSRALDFLSTRIEMNLYDFSSISNLLMLSNYCSSPDKYITTAKKTIAKFDSKKIKTELIHTHKVIKKIGFISGDIYQHPVGWFLIRLLKELSKEYSISIYYTGHRRDQLTEDFIKNSSNFFFYGDLPNDTLIKKISADENDLLIDLSGHTANNRMHIFNHRMALIQLSYLGYFSSTYMPQMDGIIFDKQHLLGVPKEFFSERIYELNCSRFCYTPPPYAPGIKPLPALDNGIITFCSFSNTSKMNKECIALWAKVINAIPNSKIQLRWKTLVDTNLREIIRQEFRSNGITNSRVELYSDCDHESLFHFYNQVDIALDTHPFSGATTCCEALWMGLPVLTLRGKTPASNQAASILSEIGLNECIASTADEYVKNAKQLAGNLAKLQDLRSSMRERIHDSSVGNPEIFVTHFKKLIQNISH